MENQMTPARPLFEKVVLIGVGLIGGSFALALKQAGAASHVVGLDRDVLSLSVAKSLGIIDSFTDDIAFAVNDADLVLIATPVAQTAAILSAIYPHLQADRKSVV